MIRPLALFCLLPLATGAAWAQVKVNQGALDSLDAGPATQSAPSAAKPPAAKRPVRRPVPVVHKPSVLPPTTPKPPPVAVAPAPPPVAILPPPPAPLPGHPLPAPVIPVLADAVGSAAPIPGGVRITFGADKADLNPATAAALHSLGHLLAADPNAAINVFAYAAGTPDDPSTPRRLSLSRALAARAVLMSEGIPSMRIYPRALGSSAAAPGPADRVDVQQAGAGAP